jgi:hypothetical protein
VTERVSNVGGVGIGVWKKKKNGEAKMFILKVLHNESS